MIVLGIGDAPAPIVAAMAGFIKAVGFVAAQTMIVLAIGDAPASIVATMAGLIKAVGFVAAADDDRARIGHAPASIVATMAGFIKAVGLVAPQAVIVLADQSHVRVHRSLSPCDATYKDGRTHGRAGDGRVLGRSRVRARHRRDAEIRRDVPSHGRAGGGRAPYPLRGRLIPDGLPPLHRDIVAMKIEHCSLVANLIGANS